MTDLQPTLEEDRILLRPLEEEDYDDLYSAASDPLIWDQHPKKRNEEKVFKAFFKESINSKGALVVIDKVYNKIIGTTRFKVIAPDAVEIGWTFLERNYWGGQFNRKMKTLMIDHLFQTVDKVVLYVDKNNNRSLRAVEKIGGEPIIHPGMDHLVQKGTDNLSFVIHK